MIEVKNIKKSYGDRVVLNNVNLQFQKNNITVLLGKSGEGKTTLFRMIMGEEKPNSGDFKVGPTVKISYVDQNHKELEPNKTVYDVISGGLDNIILGGKAMNSRAYISRFNFAGSDQGKKVSVLLNLAPRKIRGVESQGMILMAETEDGELSFVAPTKEINPGNTIR